MKQYNRINNLENIFACPVCKEEIKIDKGNFYCIRCDVNYPQNDSIYSFFNPMMYASKEDFEIAQKTAEFWGNGWEKRLVNEEQHNIYNSMTYDQFIEHAKQTLQVRKSSFEGLLVNDVNYKTLNGKLVLNIGCGAATESIVLQLQGKATVIAIDITHQAAKFTDDILSRINSQGFGVRADARNLPFKNETFDYVYSSGVLHHSKKIEVSISEIHRVLKPKGTAYISIYSSQSLQFWSLILRGYINKIINKESVQSYVNRKTETDWVTSQKIQNPLTKLTSPNQCKTLFKNFYEVKVRRGGCKLSNFPLIHRLFSQHTKIGIPFFGGGNYITAKKG